MLYLTGAAMEQMETPSFGFSISLFKPALVPVFFLPIGAVCG